MKKNKIILIAIFALSISTFLAFRTSNVIGQKEINKSKSSIPDSVMAIFKHSCIGCHGNGGKNMAMSMINFSVWDSAYSVDKQMKKANTICYEITKGAMPPASVKKNSPEKVPTTAQITMICNWANSINKK